MGLMVLAYVVSVSESFFLSLLVVNKTTPFILAISVIIIPHLVIFAMTEEISSNRSNIIILKQGTFEDLANKGRSFADVYQLVRSAERQEKSVWTGPECGLSSREEPPEEHVYTLEILVESSSSKQKLVVSGTSSQSTASTINGMLYLCSFNVGAAMDDPLDVTLKCFCATPRQLLTTVEVLPGGRRLSCLRLHFFELDEETCQALMASNIDELELRQCTMNDLDKALKQPPTPTSVQRRKALTISCTMPEFSKLAAGFGSSTCPINELTLQLHVWIQGDPWKTFTSSLKANQKLQVLKLEYLEINDQAWQNLLESLANHPSISSIHLGFTEKFVDNVRRLTPERRQARTESVLKLVQSNRQIQTFTWPDFQQDESLQAQVEQCLKRNRKQ